MKMTESAKLLLLQTSKQPESQWGRLLRVAGLVQSLRVSDKKLIKSGFVPNASFQSKINSLDLLENEVPIEELKNWLETNHKEVLQDLLSRASTYNVPSNLLVDLDTLADLHWSQKYKEVCILTAVWEERTAVRLTQQNKDARDELFKSIQGISDHLSAEIHYMKAGRPSDMALISYLWGEYHAGCGKPKSLERAKQSRIPNRNAALHGLCEYTKRIHSLNSIFIYDAMLRFVHVANETTDGTFG